MQSLSFDNLSPTQFEEFCFDLLVEMGAKRINWRKGTGHDSSPADQGRDIECSFQRTHVDGQPFFEDWFVECKHYKEGVPPAKLESFLAWAGAKQPAIALIIASNFLSNPAKQFLEDYAKSHPTGFKIKVWERKDLEGFLVGRTLLRRKYELAGDLLDVLDGLEVKERDSFFRMSFLAIINPAYNKPTDFERQCLADLISEPVNYVKFRAKFLKLCETVGPYFLVRAVITDSLAWHLLPADLTRVDYSRQNMRDSVELFRARVAKGSKQTKVLSACIVQLEEGIADIEARTRANYHKYCSFCDKVLEPLLREPPHISDEMRAQLEEAGED